ncbi:hypothetical protein VP01_21g1 [Puccinia sorghi]|uniref:Uncharacterized protein n=1 Tax=Puccinia sorghi TaxID=27349 RepID=A0A0L6V960_9BASI|nr:hypothetical protein VP01_21g1 [Puccinia sorghi]
MTYPSLQEWLQDVQIGGRTHIFTLTTFAVSHLKCVCPLGSGSQNTEREGRLVYWKLVDAKGPIPHDVLYFNDKMLFYEAPRFIPRSFMIARTACKGGKSHSNPDTYEVVPEVLCGQRDAVHWVRFSSGNAATEDEVINRRDWRPVELGRDSAGRLWFVGLAPEPHVLVPGRPLPCKIQDGTNYAVFFDENEVKRTRNFQLLVHN